MNRLALCVTLLVLPFVGCNSPTDTLNGTEQQYLFEVEHVNFAWGFFWAGIVIDHDGNITAYDHSHEEWGPAGAESYSLQQLNDKYEHGSRHVGQVDETTLQTQFEKIADVGTQLPSREYVCADAGDLTYRAFRYDSESKRYVPVVLREEGDRPRQNSSDAAESLATWLRTLVLSLEKPGVSPFTLGACTP